MRAENAFTTALPPSPTKSTASPAKATLNISGPLGTKTQHGSPAGKAPPTPVHSVALKYDITVK